MVPSDAERVRWVKILRMLGSQFPGERAAAGLLIHELVAARGYDWAELLRPEQTPVAPPGPGTPGSPPPGPAASSTRTWSVVAEELLTSYYATLRPNAVEFLTDLPQRGWALSEAQADWLADIADRCGVALWEDPPPPSRDERRARMRERRAAGRPTP
jgi:hypothetical protein